MFSLSSVLNYVTFSPVGFGVWSALSEANGTNGLHGRCACGSSSFWKYVRQVTFHRCSRGTSGTINVSFKHICRTRHLASKVCSIAKVNYILFKSRNAIHTDLTLCKNTPWSQIWPSHPPHHFQPADGGGGNVHGFLSLLPPLLPVPIWLWNGSVRDGAQHLLAQ